MTSALRRGLARPWTRGLRALGSLGRQPRRAVLAAGAVGFLGAAAFGLLKGPPVPLVHDEFAYLLQGETFAKGRLTNPTHPLWPHFETLHVIHRPSYTGKYPPGQGAALALGQAVGAPILGVWLTVGLMSGALAWMLIGWAPARWGLLVALLATAKLGFFSYWAQSYWGGALAMSGGALAYGALARILREPARRHGWWLGLGLAVLAVTRPLEGLVAAAPIAGALLWQAAIRRRAGIIRIAVVSLVVVAPALGAMALVNWRSTGDPLVMPYQVHEETYSIAPTFPWQAEREVPPYRNDEFRERHVEYSLAFYRLLRTPRGFVTSAVEKVSFWGRFFLGPLVLLVAALPWAAGDRWARWAVLAAAPVFGLTLFTQNAWPHYTAPAACLLYALVARVMVRGYRDAAWPLRVRRGLILLTVLLVGVEFGVRGALFLADDLAPHQADREAVKAALAATEGRDLVVVRYLPEHRNRYRHTHEFVYNRSDIDGAEIVWARELDERSNRQLLAYYAERCAWLLELAAAPALRPYPGAPTSCVVRGR